MLRAEAVYVQPSGCHGGCHGYWDVVLKDWGLDYFYDETLKRKRAEQVASFLNDLIEIARQEGKL